MTSEQQLQQENKDQKINQRVALLQPVDVDYEAID
jgi:hypothetical protein